jgi:hypothetical protein
MQIGGTGVTLPFPGTTFPKVNLYAGVSFALNSNRYTLPAGGQLIVPPGIWYIDPGKFGWIQFLDPVTQTWRVCGATPGKGLAKIVNSDGTNYRVLNPLGLGVGALVTNVGSSYVQSTTTVTASAGGGTWRAIVGGAVNTTVTIGTDSLGNTGGTNWTYAPTIVFDAPPAGGVPATGYAAVSAGAISAITVVNQGAGYTTTPNITIIPNPLDPTYGSITIPALTTTLTGTGDIAAILPVLPGTPQTSAPTLTIAGAGSSATATVVMALTVTALTVSGGASGTPVWATGGTIVTAAGAIINPDIGPNIYVPRQLYAYESGASAGVVIDGGIFQVAPTISPSTATATMGVNQTEVVMQLMPGT